ncbi:hypothetical protein PPERSA_07591 [Pseudocohnilembus persalinus]|uniref:Uncharacterized protein n=1 Tax=Pseudocohnilembus persalinus TaxID=266149 RepID=A0A0V0QIM1_PSEPJ|nr:hypothetical protein PPERSA_07591 [Pseudocohnilembus persalinus]|eukprot:KRX01946.1 hypothetical protein PPERSA_07591 [Pseudocohnilembus persalinus]
MKNIASFLLIILGMYEILMWTSDPFKVHQTLNNNKQIAKEEIYISCLLNGMPFIFLGHALKKNKSSLTAILFPILIIFTCMQIFFWWAPYFLGEISGSINMINEHKKQLADLPRILYPIKDHLVPDIEHTLLFPLSLLTLWTTIVSFKKEFQFQKSDLIKSKIFGGLLIALTFVGEITQIYKSNFEKKYQNGLLIAQICMITVFTIFLQTAKIQKEQNKKIKKN